MSRIFKIHTKISYYVLVALNLSNFNKLQNLYHFLQTSDSLVRLV